MSDGRDGLKGKVALVAGGTGGLGREIALAFLAAGARVAVTYRVREEFDGLAAAASSAGNAAPGAGSPALPAGSALIAAPVDVTDPAAVTAAAQKLTEQTGRLDILVNAVGAFAGGKNLWEEDLATYQRMMGLNLLSGFVLARAVLPAMIAQKRGWVVNIASRAGYGHSAGAALYAASKAGALALFDSLAEEVKPYAINVNSVVPSIIDTPANRRAMPTADFAAWPKPADIAEVVLFLCSEQARLIHGAAIPVYGKT